jgi:teichuronic acid biosynthesis glycosyltransferase TuaC
MSGVFISYRIKSAINQGNKYSLIFLNEEYDCLYSALRKLWGQDDGKKKIPPHIVQNDVEWTAISYKTNIADLLYKNLLKKRYLRYKCKKIAREITYQVDFSQYDAIHCHWAHPEGYIGSQISRKTNLPLIITCHGSDIHTNPSQNTLIKQLTVEAITNADKVIFVSNFLLKTAQGLGYSGENSVVIPNGVDTSLFTIQDRELQKKKHGMSGKVVGFVGDLKAVKRADKLPEIFKKIQEKQKNVEFLIVGDGEFRKLINEECNKLAMRVKFVGTIQPHLVPQYINAMDLLILPSRNEGWPCVVLESQACGVPVIGSDNGGIPEAIGDGGEVVKNGEEFEMRFAEAVVRSLDRKWDREALRQRAMKYDWSSTVNDEIMVYASAISSKRKQPKFDS